MRFKSGGIEGCFSGRASSWFDGMLVRDVGKGDNTLFWYHRWLEGEVWKDKFPRLFQITENNDAYIAEVIVATSEGSEFRCARRRRLFVWEP